MGLKADRIIHSDRIDCVTPTGVAIVQGSVLVSPTGLPAGKAVGQGLNDAAPQAVPTGSGGPPTGVRVLGVLLDAVVVIDPTRYVRNLGKTEQLAGENVCLVTDGTLWTDMYTGTPTANAPAFVGANSKWQTTAVNGLASAGFFETSPGADGFVKVTIKVA